VLNDAGFPVSESDLIALPLTVELMPDVAAELKRA
jgi:hypothetical protein